MAWPGQNLDKGVGIMSIINWFQGVVGWLQTDGRWDLVTLGLAFATLIYVGVAIAISIRADLQARETEAKVGMRVASVKRTAEHPMSRPAAMA
jgi:hypothetical protein